MKIGLCKSYYGVRHALRNANVWLDKTITTDLLQHVYTRLFQMQQN